jgi:hypothetical protein
LQHATVKKTITLSDAQEHVVPSRYGQHFTPEVWCGDGADKLPAGAGRSRSAVLRAAARNRFVGSRSATTAILPCDAGSAPLVAPPLRLQLPAAATSGDAPSATSRDAPSATCGDASATTTEHSQAGQAAT